MADDHLRPVDSPPAAVSSADAVAPVAAQAALAPHRTRGLLKIALDVLLIGTGVFLGLLGDQWREHAQQRQAAEESLRRFRAEILQNREAVAGVEPYHREMRDRISRYLDADRRTRKRDEVQVRGLQPVFFARTAWDLALATQSLAYVDPAIAVGLSRAYTLQQDYADLTRGVMQALYLRPPSDNVDAFLGTVSVYYGDIVLWEPRLLEMYDQLVPQLDRALGDSSSPGERGASTPAAGAPAAPPATPSTSSTTSSTARPRRQRPRRQGRRQRRPGQQRV